jgi:PAS domain S-box-containing protein
MIAELQTAIANTPARKRVDQHLSASDRVKMRAERMALLIRGAPVEIGIGVINAALVLFIGWKGVDHDILRLWGGLAFTLALARLFLWRVHARPGAHAHGLADYARWHIAGMGLNGALWGALGPIFALHGMLGDAFLPFMIAAMTATALASAGASWRAVLAFSIPALLPFSAAYALLDLANGPVFGAVVLLYAAAIAWLAWSTQEMIQRSIRLRSRNEHLLGALKKQVDAAHEAEKRYRGLVESSADLTLIFSPEGRIVYASPSINQTLGAPAANFLGQTTKDLVHPDDLPLFRAVGEKSLSRLGEVIALPHVCLRGADGAFRPFGGRLTNMLYVPGVDGFVFSGGRTEENRPRLHAAE